MDNRLDRQWGKIEQCIRNTIGWDFRCRAKPLDQRSIWQMDAVFVKNGIEENNGIF